MLLFIKSGLSFMYKRNRASTEPWGTSDMTGLESDSSPSRITHCVLLDRKRIWVVSAQGRFGLSCFSLGRFGQFLGWVVSALVGESFRPIFWVSRFGPESFQPNYMETHQGYINSKINLSL